MFKPMIEKLPEAHFGSVMPVLPEPSYERFHALPEPADAANFGPIVTQSDFGSADTQQQHTDAVLETASIRVLLGRCLSRVMKLQGLAFVENAEAKLAPLRDALGSAFGLAAIEETLMAEFLAAAAEQHESVLQDGKKQSGKLAKLREELLAADMQFENANAALQAVQNELRMRRGEPMERWATSKDRKKRERELSEVQERIELLRTQTAQAVETFNAKQAEVEAAQAELVEIDRAERRLRAMLDGDTFATDPEYGLSRSTGAEPSLGFKKF